MKATTILLPILFFILISCQPNNSDKIYGLSISGSSTVYPVTSLIVSDYKSMNGRFNIHHSVTGTNDALRRFVEGDLLFANASRKMTVQEKELSKQNDVDFEEFVIGYDGITILVNAENDWVDFLTLDELQKIWSEDGHKYWSDVRPHWPKKFILKYGPGEESGTLSYFQDAILKDASLATNYVNSVSDEILTNGIAKDLYSLGFLGLAYYKKNDEKVKRVPLDTGSGPVNPSEKTINDGSYDLLSRPLFIYVNSKVVDSKDGKKFLKYFFENVASAIENVGYVPMEEEAYSSLVRQFR